MPPGGCRGRGVGPLRTFGVPLFVEKLTKTVLASGLLFGVTARDPLMLGSAAAVIAAVSLVACFLPAAAALRLSPVAALRSE